jgi:xylulose-5-phosphate/fructose-6-phosphate phosphoketolase
MAVRNNLDRFHLASDVVHSVPGLGTTAAHVKQLVRDKLIEHRGHIARHGIDMPEIREWRLRPTGDEAEAARL